MKRGRTNIHFTVCVTLLLLATVVCWFVLSPGIRSRPASETAISRNNLKMLYLGLRTYNDDHGCLPPAYLTHPKTRAKTSWRVLLLPYLEYGSFWENYEVEQEWNGVKNTALAERIRAPLEYQCAQSGAPLTSATGVFAVVGPETAWPTEGTVDLHEIEQVSNLILLVTVVDSTVHWMQPSDLNTKRASQEIDEHDINRHPTSGTIRHLLFADGTVWSLSPECPLQEIAKFFTIDKAKANSRDQALRPYRL